MILYTRKHKRPFQIDENDQEAVSYYTWYVSHGYITTSSQGRTLSLHQFLMGRAPNGLQWDHKNRDKFDNRRENFRAVTVVVNQRNVGLRKDNKSGVIGVRMNRHGDRWMATICNKGVCIKLGSFDTIAEAAVVRKKAELELWGSER